MKEIREKEKRVRKYLSDNKLDALLISGRNNFAWFTGGANNYVGLNKETGSSSVLVTGQKKYVISDAIEIPRIAGEELREKDFVFEEYEWFNGALKPGLIRRLAGKNAVIGSDAEYPDTKRVSLAALQSPLLDAEIKRYEKLGRMSSECVEKAAFLARPGLTEYQVAGLLSEALYAKGIIPVVLMVAADDRVFKYRHPIPTDKKIKRYVMLVVCAEKWGLIASLTRLVHFGKLPRVIREKQDSVLKIDASFILESVPGAKVGGVFKHALEMYAATGYRNEWRKHHQGGPTGYASREYRAVPESAEILAEGRALAWNPSISGVKSEDTIIVGKGFPSIITPVHKWPVVKVNLGGRSVLRPDILIR